MAFVTSLWFIVVCDPQWLLTSFGASFMRQVPTGLFALLLVLIMFNWPRHWHLPLLTLFLYTAVMVPLAENPAYAIGATKLLTLYYVLTVGTLKFVRSPGQALPIIALYFLGQYIWWIAFGVRDGLVLWDPTFDNYDGYGPLMCVAIPSCFYFGLALKRGRLKWLSLLTAAGAVFALVSSFKRGAIMAGLAVALFVWIRAPARNKRAVTLAGAAALLLVVIGAQVFSGMGRGATSDQFWSEMGSTFTEYKENTGDVEDRQVLWRLARREFAAKPVFGVGAENFGVYAATHFESGTVGGDYDRNALTLYDRKLHSVYFQLLAEYGSVGVLIMAWLLADFWIRNRRLRSPARNAAFDAALGGVLSLKHLALGLEGSMIGFLASGLFYNMLYVHWLYTIAGMNLLLYQVSGSGADTGRRSGATRSPAGRVGRPLLQPAHVVQLPRK